MAWPVILAAAGAAGNLGIGIANTINQSSANQQNVAATNAANQANAQTSWATTLYNQMAQDRANQQNRQWSIDDWNRANAYNHPLQQMQRLREAGLNPHLVYGNGAQTTASAVQTPRAQASQADRYSAIPAHVAPVTLPQADLLTPFMQVFDLKAKQAQTDNLEEQNRLLKQKQLMGDLTISGQITKNARSEFDLQLARELKDSTMEAARLQNQYRLESTKKVIADTASTITGTQLKVPEYELKRQELRLKQSNSVYQNAQINAQTMKLVFENANLQPLQKVKLEAEINNLLRTGELKDIDIALRDNGINPSDPSYMRVFVTLAQKIMEKYNIPGKELIAPAMHLIPKRPPNRFDATGSIKLNPKFK